MSSPTVAPARARARAVDSWWARWLVPFVVPILLVSSYELYARSAADAYFPPLGDISSAARELWFGSGLTQHVLPSLTNLAIGYVAGFALGLLVGVILGRVALVRRIVQPLVSFGLTLPTIALLPIFLLAFGIGSTMQRATIAFAVFFIAVINTADGVRGTDPVLLDVAQVYRLPTWRRVLQVVLPAASAHILAAALVGLNAALLVMVVGEMVGASRGIGAVTLLAQQDFAYDRMWAGIVLLAVLGIVLNWGFQWFERRVVTRLGLTDASAEKG